MQNMSPLKPYPFWRLLVPAFAISGIVAGITALLITRALGDGDDRAPPRSPVTTWQCGAVILQYETISGPGWYRTTYRVINPDAISYDRSYGPPRYFVEWTGVDGRGEMLTLNGWPCQPARL